MADFRSLTPKLATFAACLLLVGPTVQAAPKSSKTLGFVLTNWTTAFYETPLFDECPEGFAQGYDEIWWLGISKEDRDRLTNKGTSERTARSGIALRRGPHGEDVCLNPTAVKDPPMPVVEGKYGYGMNLDGTEDGHATAKTCAHKKFETPDGQKGIDNQMYRLVGCNYGFHPEFGIYDVNANETHKNNGLGMVLLEISGVTDARNDDDVTVTIYRSTDPYIMDSGGDYVPFASYRIDAFNGKPRYGGQVHGKIVDGELITDPGDVRVPWYGNYTYVSYRVRDFKIKMKISPDGATAKGMVAGYFETEQFLHYFLGLGSAHSNGFANCPSMYVAAHQLADGYPDPQTGECTALSAAYDIQAVAAYIVHPDEVAGAKREQDSFEKLKSLFTKVKG